jgi:predicted DNA-binding protein (MmcQ/YjbR family)
MGGAYDDLRATALSYPESYEEFPWGECAIKVRGKMFLIMRDTDRGLTVSLKLPRSREFALNYPFAKPTGYGLGKSGWISSSFAPGEAPPADVFAAWIDESYRAIAPKRLTAALPVGRPPLIEK